jgi:hypothetical protein
MSYDQHDASMDMLYEQIGLELYPSHKAQAISEFTADRLRSYYVEHPDVMRPAVDALQEGKRLNEAKHYAAAVVFFVSAIELLLKATLLKPVVHGLIHHEGMADIIVQHALGQTGFDRYKHLLAQLFSELAGLELAAIRRSEAPKALLDECVDLQKLRKHIIHQGASCDSTQADLGHQASVAVYDLIVVPMLTELGGLKVTGGRIVPKR